MNVRHLVALLFMSGCGLTNSTSEAEIGFNKIIPNQTTPAEAIVFMGQPARRSQIQVAGLVDVQIMEFHDEKNTYLLTVGGSPLAGIEPRVFMKEMRSRKGETN